MAGKRVFILLMLVAVAYLKIGEALPEPDMYGNLDDADIGDVWIEDLPIEDPEIGDLPLENSEIGDLPIEDSEIGDLPLEDPEIGDLPLEDSEIGDLDFGDTDIGHVDASGRQINIRCTVVCTKWNVCALKQLRKLRPRRVIKKCGFPPGGCRCLGFAG